MLVLGLPTLDFDDPSRGIHYFMESLRSTLLTPLVEYATVVKLYGIHMLNLIDPSRGIC